MNMEPVYGNSYQRHGDIGGLMHILHYILIAMLGYTNHHLFSEDKTRDIIHWDELINSYTLIFIILKTIAYSKNCISE